MKIKNLILIAFLLFIGNTIVAQTNKKSAKKENGKKFAGTAMLEDAKFVMKVGEFGMYEVQMAKLAGLNAFSNNVIELANLILNDLNKMNEELKTMSEIKGITLATTLNKKLQKDIDEFITLEDLEFDRAYTRLIVDDYNEMIELFTKQAINGTDIDIKNWAVSKLPTLKYHLGLGETAYISLQETVKK